MIGHGQPSMRTLLLWTKANHYYTLAVGSCEHVLLAIAQALVGNL